ncbi:uncharacterized protein LOC111062561 [Nilaparvata lugens]|uniref:uncharacterized protein LOC111062561 n=1 Tax=Nilaparvata lugens TaxID=108931 RepID=UPI00193D2588|nr:uncharacterized protein LOC111062561 [Nilaparvata lugens]
MFGFLLFAAIFVLVFEYGLCNDVSGVVGPTKIKEGFMERRISENDDVLEIGRLPTVTFHGDYTCEEFAHEDDYNDKYLTYVTLIPGSNNQTEKLEAGKILDYFFHILRKEIWSCHHVDDSVESPAVYRIVNEFIGIRQIGVIRYTPNIVVKTKYYLGERRQTAWLREVAFYKTSTSGSALEPCSGNEMTLCSLYHYSRLLTKRRAEYTPYQPGTGVNNQEILELKYFEESRPIAFTRGEDIPAMSLGSKLSEYDLGSSKSVAVCNEIQGVRPFPFSYRTMATVHGRVGNTDFKAFHVQEDFYYELMVPTVEQVWLCTISKGDDLHDQFYRIFNELVGRRPVGKMNSYHTIVYVADVLLPHGKKSFKSREIKYVDPESGTTVNYRGSLKLYREKKELDMNSREMKFGADPGCIFRSLVGARGYDFRIGTKWGKVIGDRTSKVRYVYLYLLSWDLEST